MPLRTVGRSALKGLYFFFFFCLSLSPHTHPYMNTHPHMNTCSQTHALVGLHTQKAQPMLALLRSRERTLLSLQPLLSSFSFSSSSTCLLPSTFSTSFSSSSLLCIRFPRHSFPSPPLASLEPSSSSSHHPSSLSTFLPTFPRFVSPHHFPPYHAAALQSGLLQMSATGSFSRWTPLRSGGCFSLGRTAAAAGGRVL